MRLWVVNLGILTTLSLVVLVSCPAKEEAPKPKVMAQPVVQPITPAPQEQPAQTVDPTWVGDAMDFSFTTFEGENVQASSFAGKPVVLNFWASW